MTDYEKMVKKQEILAHLENDILNHACQIAQLASDAWKEVDELYGGYEGSFTDVQNRVNKTLRRYLGV